jgi:hypothetical protein
VNCWKQLDALKKEAEDLKHALDAIGWSLLTPSLCGKYRAKKRGSHRAVIWRECLGATPKELLANVDAEIKRHEPENKARVA